MAIISGDQFSILAVSSYEVNSKINFLLFLLDSHSAGYQTKRNFSYSLDNIKLVETFSWGWYRSFWVGGDVSNRILFERKKVEKYDINSWKTAVKLEECIWLTFSLSTDFYTSHSSITCSR